MFRVPPGGTPPPAGPPSRAERYLSPDPPVLEVEVDVVEGAQVTDRGLALWRLELLERLPKREIVIRRDEIIPAASWQGMDSLPDITRAHRSDRESDGVASLYVVVAPEAGGTRGYGWSPPDGKPLSKRHPEIVIFSRALRPILWLSRSQQEASVLLHETGHVLGLVSDPAHGAGAHCTHGECLMTNGVSAASLLVLGPQVLLGRMPMEFCRSCRRNLWGPAGLSPFDQAQGDL